MSHISCYDESDRIPNLLRERNKKWTLHDLKHILSRTTHKVICGYRKKGVPPSPMNGMNGKSGLDLNRFSTFWL